MAGPKKWSLEVDMNATNVPVHMNPVLLLTSCYIYIYYIELYLPVRSTQLSLYAFSRSRSTYTPPQPTTSKGTLRLTLERRFQKGIL
jgi:hypothetical protein